MPLLTGEMALEGSAERVLVINVLHEIGDDALKELAAMLKPGGWAHRAKRSRPDEYARGASPPYEELMARLAGC